MISPGRSRLSYLSAEGQWTRAGVIEIGAGTARLLVADRRPAHAIPLWDHQAPVPAETHGYQLRHVLDESVSSDITQLVARAAAAGCAELHLIAELAPSSGADRFDAAQSVARAVGRPVHVLTPHRAGELLVLGGGEALDPAVEALLVRCGGETIDVALTRARRYMSGATLPVGLETLAARHSDPPREGELKVLRHRVRATLRALPTASPRALVVAAEAGDAVALLPALAGLEHAPARGRSRAGAVTSRDARITLEGVRRALRTLQSTHSARLARSTRLPQDSLRRLPTAALILEALMERCGLDACRLIPRGLRHGTLIAAAEDPEHWWVDLEAARLRRERLEQPRGPSTGTGFEGILSAGRDPAITQRSPL